MKKLLTILLLLITTNAYAESKVIVNKQPTSATPVSASLLDASPTSVTSSGVNIAGYERVGIYWTYDETQVGGVSAALTIEVSPDGTTYFSAPFFDTAGAATPQTTESLTADGSYIAWFDNRIPFNFIRTIVTCTGCDADDTVLTTVKLYYDRG